MFKYPEIETVDRSYVNNIYKNFHFQEINWVVSFPLGNAGKYRDYNVLVKNQNNISQPQQKFTKLGDVLASSEIEQKYPHTVGYFKFSTGEGPDFKPAYLELREIRTEEEFWAFLNSLNL
jgi:hypothetical protein